jgi:hypothetical protein
MISTESTEMIKWIWYPRSDKPPEVVRNVVAVVEANAGHIDSGTHTKQDGTEVLAKLSDGLRAVGFEVETGKKRAQQIRVPVLFGLDGI